MCGFLCDPVRLSSWYFGNTFLKDLECYFSAEFLHWDTLDILWRSPKAHSIARISRYTCTCYNFAILAHLCTSVDMTSSGVKDKGDPHQSHWASIVSSFGQQRINIASRAAATLRRNICAWGSQMPRDWSLSRRIFRTFPGIKWHRRGEDIEGIEGWIFRLVSGWTNHARGIPSSHIQPFLPLSSPASWQQLPTSQVQARPNSCCDPGLLDLFRWDMTGGGPYPTDGLPWTCSSLVCSVLHGTSMALSVWFG